MAIKRQMIKAIHAGIPGWADEPEEQREIVAKYKKYGDQVSYEFSCFHDKFSVKHFLHIH